MRSGEAQGLKRLLGTHAELHVVEDNLESCLILLVATRNRDRHHRLVVMEKQRGAQRDSRPLARLDHVGSSCKSVQAAEPASVNNDRVSGHAAFWYMDRKATGVSALPQSSDRRNTHRDPPTRVSLLQSPCGCNPPN